MIIREIEFEDAASLANLIRDVENGSETMLYEPNERKVSAEIQGNMINAFKKGENFNIFVAEDQNELVGYLLAIGGTARRKSHSAAIVIGIREEFRGKGVGTQLFEKMEEWALKQGIHRLELTVMASNESGQALYKKMGFEVEGIKKHSLVVDGNYVDEIYMYKLLS